MTFISYSDFFFPQVRVVIPYRNLATRNHMIQTIIHPTMTHKTKNKSGKWEGGFMKTSSKCKATITVLDNGTIYFSKMFLSNSLISCPLFLVPGSILLIRLNENMKINDKDR